MPILMEAQPVVRNTFPPNSATISTSEGAPYGDCDFWVTPAASCATESNFGYGPTKVVRLYICLSGEVSLDSCSQQPAATGALSQTMVERINAGIAAYAGTGIRLVIRFIYNFGPIGPGAMDAPLNVILMHIDQLAPVLLQNKDLIFALEAGFIGTWGEWHDSTDGNGKTDAHKAVLDKEISHFSGAFPILVRYPGILLDYTGTSVPRSNLGIHDDYYASSATDGGTWSPCLPSAAYCRANDNASRIMSYSAAVSATAILVGEFGALYPTLQNCDALDAYSSLLHPQSISLFPYPSEIGTELQHEGCAASFFNKVGTRIVLQEAAISGNPTPGGKLSLALSMHNAGYGRVIRQRSATLILRQNGLTVAQIPIPVANMDLRTLQPSARKTFQFEFALPGTVLPGPVSVALFIPDPAPSLSSQPSYALPLNSVDQQNRSIFDPTTGFNLIAEFTITCTTQLNLGAQELPTEKGTSSTIITTAPGCPPAR